MKRVFKRSIVIAALLFSIANGNIYALSPDGGSHFRWLDRFERWVGELLEDVIVIPHG